MHGLIMGVPKKPFVVDHINHDTLDNRRSNLRIVTYSENCKNRKVPSKGHITFLPKRNRWQVYKSKKYVGIFTSKEAAQKSLEAL